MAPCATRDVHSTNSVSKLRSLSSGSGRLGWFFTVLNGKWRGNAKTRAESKEKYDRCQVVFRFRSLYRLNASVALQYCVMSRSRQEVLKRRPVNRVRIAESKSSALLSGGAAMDKNLTMRQRPRL